MFSLADDNNKELFIVFCEDIISISSQLRDDNKIYKAIINRFYSWKKLFSSSRSRLSESEITGLIGELLFLKDFLFDKYGKGESLKGWSGQEMTHKDFFYNDIWYEVKSVNSGKETVHISSLEQLQSANSGELVVFVLEQMSPNYAGIKLNVLCKEILDVFDNLGDRDDFLNKIMRQGFSFDEDYNDKAYEIVSMTRYNVDSTFPKLLRSNICDAISKVQYELSLPQLRKHIIRD